MYVKFNLLQDAAIRVRLVLIATELWLVSDHYPFGTVLKATFFQNCYFLASV